MAQGAQDYKSGGPRGGLDRPGSPGSNSHVLCTRPAFHALGVALLLCSGHAAAQDSAAAPSVGELESAAEKGDMGAQYRLAELYEGGLGVPANFDMAARWYKSAAKQGDSNAMHRLGSLLYRGKSVPPQTWGDLTWLVDERKGIDQDFPAARALFEQAAALGHPKSRTSLGFMHNGGQGVPQDFIEAAKWYMVAGDQGDEEARVYLKKLTPRLTADDLREARRRADYYRARVRGGGASPVSVAQERAFTSDVDQPPFKVRVDPRLFAVIIGVEKYKGGDKGAALPPARFAQRDASVVRAYAHALGYAEGHVVAIEGQHATRAGIQKYIEDWLPKNAGADSSVLIYFAGHGAPDPSSGEPYLIPWDGDTQYLATTGYSRAALLRSLAKLKARRITVVLDTCFSGAGGRSLLTAGARPLVAKVVEAKITSPKITLLAASGGDQIAGNLESEGHGIFTYYFLKALGGGARKGATPPIMSEIYGYLRPRVEQAARRQNHEQTPFLAGDADHALASGR